MKWKNVASIKFDIQLLEIVVRMLFQVLQVHRGQHLLLQETFEAIRFHTQNWLHYNMI